MDDYLKEIEILCRKDIIVKEANFSEKIEAYYKFDKGHYFMKSFFRAFENNGRKRYKYTFHDSKGNCYYFSKEQYEKTLKEILEKFREILK